MANLEIAPGDIEKFHEWLEDNRRGDQKLLALWVLLTSPTQWRSYMGQQDQVFKQAWLNEVAGCASRGKVGWLKGLAERSRDSIEDDPPPDSLPIAGKLRAELLRELEKVLIPIFEGWESESSPEAKEKAEKLRKERAAAKLTPARTRAIRLLDRANEGAFWYTSQAADGEPYVVLSFDSRLRPAPGLVALGKVEAEGAKKGPPPKISSGTWSIVDGYVYLDVTSGDTDITKGFSEAVKRTARLGKPKQVNNLDAEVLQHVALLEKGNRNAAKGRTGWFWFVTGLAGRKAPAVVLRAVRESGVDDWAKGYVQKYGVGQWTSDPVSKVVVLAATGPLASDRNALTRLRSWAHTTRIFGKVSVDVSGTGILIRDPQRSDAVGDPNAGEAEHKQRLTRIAQENRQAATAMTGNFWFCQNDRSEAPLLVLYRGQKMLFEASELVSSDANRARNIASGTWLRISKDSEVRFLLQESTSKFKLILPNVIRSSGLFRERSIQVLMPGQRLSPPTLGAHRGSV